MSLQEALATGGETTALGLSIVFSVLIILMLVLMVMEKIFYKKDKGAPAAAPAPAPAPAAAAPAAPVDDAELIAVLTAAVAASLNTSTYNLKIKSYRRVGTSSPAWRRAGINDTINTRF